MRVTRLLARFFFTDVPKREGLWSSKPCCRLDMNSMIFVHGVTSINQEALLNHVQLLSIQYSIAGREPASLGVNHNIYTT